MARRISVQILGDSSSLERAFKRSSSAAGTFNRDLSRAGRGVVAVTAGYRNLARSVAFASTAFIGTAGVTAGLKASITGFSQFNDAMQKSVGLAGVAEKNIAGFSREILALAPKVGKSPQELANAFFFVASSGIKAAQAMSVVTAAAKASAAGLGETQVVADAVTSAMNAYGPSVLSAQKATDVLVATVREGKGEADQFAGVIGNVAALASQLGVSFNEVGAALAAETRLGVDAETAATQLQRVFSSLVKVTPAQAKAFKSVGLNADQLREQLGSKGLLFVLEEVRKAFAGNLPALAKAFGDVRAVRGVLALVGNQASATRGIFDRMAKSAGSLDKAFGAVSTDTAQQFRKLRAAAEVTGISVGAVFAPLAGRVAGALADASAQLTAFFNRIGRARSFSAKLSVVFTGLENAGQAIERSLGDAVTKVDWNRVWARANGIADGLQARLEQINWAAVGAAIGDGIRKGVAGSAAAIKDLGARVSQVIGSIDFVKLGKRMGPGLAAAVVTAFTTLLDPAFWVKNWDLALSVAAVAFGGSVGRIAGRLGATLARPFARLGADAAIALAGSIEGFAPRVADAVLALFVRLPGLIGRALDPLAGVVSRRFARLGGLARFTVKVLGIDAAINAVAAMISRLAHLIGGGLDRAWEHMKRQAIKAALDIVEPFSHLPGFLGGGPFQDMKRALQRQLDGMTASARDAAAAISDALAGVTATGSSAAEAAGSPRRAARPAPTVRAPAVKAVAKSAAVQQATKVATDTATATVVKGFVLPFRLQLAQARAEATTTAKDDLAVARQVREFIAKAIPRLHGQKLLDAYSQLGQVNQTIAAALEKAKTFTLPASLQLAEARAQALGKPLTSVLVKMRAAAEKALKSGRLSVQGQIDAWNTIFDVNQQLQDQAKSALGGFRQLNTKKLAESFGLTGDALRRMRAALSQVGPGGTIPAKGVGAFGVAFGADSRPLEIHTHVEIDKRQVGQAVTKVQQKRRLRNPPQVRGPFAGGLLSS